MALKTQILIVGGVIWLLVLLAAILVSKKSFNFDKLAIQTLWRIFDIVSGFLFGYLFSGV